jgi:hypothetical protein
MYFELSQVLHAIQQTLHRCRQQAQGINVTSLSRLQRSLISEQVAAVSKDSTVNLGAFLSTVLTSLENYLEAGFVPGNWLVSHNKSRRAEGSELMDDRIGHLRLDY